MYRNEEYHLQREIKIRSYNRVHYDVVSFAHERMPELWQAREKLFEYFSSKNGLDLGSAVQRILTEEIPAEVIEPIFAFLKKNPQEVKDVLPDKIYDALEKRNKTYKPAGLTG